MSKDNELSEKELHTIVNDVFSRMGIGVKKEPKEEIIEIQNDDGIRKRCSNCAIPFCVFIKSSDLNPDDVFCPLWKPSMK